ncbi:MAG: 3-deoxy-D-manno-octulosonic acid transferase [Alphaproteobacteria bacterium]|nr:3-deoxy-D-manno-octulosonic acid transferase [Alphaproteobacteria bacterium]
MLLKFYRIITILCMPLIRLHLKKRKAKGKEDAERFNERLGQPSLKRPKGQLVWLHGASVGESFSMLPVIERILSSDKNSHVLVTTGTVTSAKLMQERLPDRAFHQYVPVDVPSYTKRFIEYWKPDACLWFESDLWPNLLRESEKAGISMALVNGRISDKSFKTWSRFKFTAKKLFSPFSLCLAQTQEGADRLSYLGATNVSCEGNLKYTAAPLPVDEKELELLKKQIGTRPVWLASSTHSGEDPFVFMAHNIIKKTLPNLLTIIVPRHPERGAGIAQELSNIDGKKQKISLRSNGDEIDEKTDVYVADTIGELGLFYRVSPVVLMGKTLRWPGGGQNPIEPARLGCVVIMGEYTSNFKEVSANMVNNDAAIIINFEFSHRVDGTEDMADMAISLLKNHKQREIYSANAIAFAENEANVLDRVCAKIDFLKLKKI